jgi:hypothetical protein
MGLTDSYVIRDADGVTLHVGDVVYLGGIRGYVAAIQPRNGIPGAALAALFQPYSGRKAHWVDGSELGSDRPLPPILEGILTKWST